MLNESILDEIFPIPDIESLKEEKVAELKEEGFVITNFNSGGIFHTLLMIVLQARIELIKLLHTLLKQMFIQSAEGKWLELRASDFSKQLKAATKTQGEITLNKTEEALEQVINVMKGSVFKTSRDINNEELKFYAVDNSTIPSGSAFGKIKVEAEHPGTKYNVSVGQIKKSLIYYEGIEEITNDADWIKKEGSDTEDYESLKKRTLASWAELASRPIAAKYKNVCEAVEGVLYVRVDDMHPRGQGTVDIIVTSTAGSATEKLLEEVQAAAEKIKGEYDNLLVKSAITVSQDIDILITLPSMVDNTNIKERVTALIINYFKINKERNLNEFILVDLIFVLKSNISLIKNVKLENPQGDVILEKDKVILLGNINVTIVMEE